MDKLTSIGSILGNQPFLNKMNSYLDPQMIEDPKEYWESIFQELKIADFPSEYYTKSASLELLHIWLDQKKCHGCTGFLTCPKPEDSKGHQFSIGVTEAGIFPQITKCNFYREFLNQEQERRLWSFSGLNEGHRRMTFENFPNEQKQLNKELCKKAYQFANQYVPGIEMKGLYIFGSFGTAKTHMACAILNKLISRKIKVLYVQAEKTFAALSDLYFRENRDGLPTRSEILDKYISTDVLVIDELGHENVNESSIWALYTILNGREPERKPVIITSNYSPMQLMAHYLNKASDETSQRTAALVSRLSWLTDHFEMIGQDYRTKDL